MGLKKTETYFSLTDISLFSSMEHNRAITRMEQRVACLNRLPISLCQIAGRLQRIQDGLDGFEKLHQGLVEGVLLILGPGLINHFPMPALIWSNMANPAFLLQLLDYFLDTGMAQSKRIHHFLNGYSLFLPNHLQYFLPTFLLTLPRTRHPGFGRKRDDGDKGVSFNELGLGALGVQGQVLADVQDTRPEFLTTAHLHEEFGKRRILGIRSESLTELDVMQSPLEPFPRPPLAAARPGRQVF